MHIIEPGAHKTNLIEKSRIIHGLQKQWEGLGEDLKKEYGQKYFDKGKTVNLMLISF